MGLSVAARYTRKADAESAFRSLQFRHRADLTRAGLSVYHFYSDPYWYVAVVGESEDLKDFVPLANLMGRRGQIIALPDPTHDALLARRQTHQS